MDTHTDDNNTSEKFMLSLSRFLELVEVPRFRQNFRYVLFHYLLTHHDELMPDFKWFIEDMRFFFELLDDLKTSKEPTK